MVRRIPSIGHVIVDSIGDRGCSRQDARRSHFINRYPQCGTIQVPRLSKRRRFQYFFAGFVVKQLKYKLSLSMSTLATDSKDCAAACTKIKQRGVTAVLQWQDGR